MFVVDLFPHDYSLLLIVAYAIYIQGYDHLLSLGSSLGRGLKLSCRMRLTQQSWKQLQKRATMIFSSRKKITTISVCFSSMLWMKLRSRKKCWSRYTFYSYWQLVYSYSWIDSFYLSAITPRRGSSVRMKSTETDLARLSREEKQIEACALVTLNSPQNSLLPLIQKMVLFSSLTRQRTSFSQCPLTTYQNSQVPSAIRRQVSRDLVRGKLILNVVRMRVAMTIIVGIGINIMRMESWMTFTQQFVFMI